MKNYEITFFTNEEQTAPILSLLQKNGAQITEEKPMQKMMLAYPIKKQIQCFMGLIRFSADGSILQRINDSLRLESALLRFMIRVGKDNKIFSSQHEGVSVPLRQEKEKTNSEKRGVKRFFEKILTNEALEKKIEEMLQ